MFRCLECGKKYRTARSAERAAQPLMPPNGQAALPPAQQPQSSPTTATTQTDSDQARWPQTVEAPFENIAQTNQQANQPAKQADTSPVSLRQRLRAVFDEERGSWQAPGRVENKKRRCKDL